MWAKPFRHNWRFALFLTACLGGFSIFMSHKEVSTHLKKLSMRCLIASLISATHQKHQQLNSLFSSHILTWSKKVENKITNNHFRTQNFVEVINIPTNHHRKTLAIFVRIIFIHGSVVIGINVQAVPYSACKRKKNNTVIPFKHGKMYVRIL